ncbi:nucleoside diphosphate kinase 7 [Aricia agestis]|uniref:nucleoside diphosphate kinase 7 n=1 Tax=Aricia agestis TaxID=91739 RepID=UPI001C208BD2|nr:nucleoside diphosphate kinase 7 [Aricia agestis]
MEGSFCDKYSFIGEWYDNQASMVRRFNLYYYTSDDTIEMFDLRSRKTFLRRVKVNGINLENFYIGATLYILGRHIKVVDFACEYTKKKLHKDIQVTFVIIKPLETKTVGRILSMFHEGGLRITKLKKTYLSTDDTHVLLKSEAADNTFPFLLEHLTEKMVHGVELVGKDAVSACLKLAGDKDPTKAAEGTIRALYGEDLIKNCVDVAPSLEVAVKNINYFFPPATMNSVRLKLTATLSNCTLCIVKPHAIREGKLGAALEAIDEGGFDITALNMFVVENVNAAEFYEVYKGIVQEYKGMVDELASGPCVAMEIVAKDKNVNTAVEFRKLVGPSDPEIARLLRPNTLRAKLGKTKVQNAIHCSDLAEDGVLEVEYFFKILDM